MCDPAKHLLTFGVDDPHGHHRYTTTNGSAAPACAARGGAIDTGMMRS
jgi:hypothetical protein